MVELLLKRYLWLIKWALDSFSFGELLLGNASIADKILLEYIPSGREWLAPILRALQQNRKLDIEYENFVGLKFKGTISPLCVKLFKRRWYVLALVYDKRFRIYSLDRITALEVKKHKYIYPSEFLPSEFFESYFGITAQTSEEPEAITLRVYDELRGYLKSLPIHHSQEILKEDGDWMTVSVKVASTFDFIQEILSHREQLEVLKPESLRNKIYSIISKMSDLYRGVE